MEYDKAIVVPQLIAELSQHGIVKRAVEAVGIDRETLTRWRIQDAQLDADVSRAIETGLEAHADALLTAHDELDPARAKIYSDNAKWLLARRLRPKYGDSLDLNVQRIDISTTLIEARARSRPICDLQNVIDAQVVEDEQEKLDRPTDKVSVAPATPQSADAGKNDPDELDKLMESIT